MTDKVIDEKLMFRLWAKDNALFVGEPMLDWLDEPMAMEAQLANLLKIASSLRSRFSFFVLMGMGGSSASARMFKEILAPNAAYFFILDSIHPGEVARVEEAIDPLKTLFIVASKSGSTMEPMLLYHHFLGGLSKLTSDPYSHFLALTDPISPLEQESVEKGFLHAPLGKPCIGGRYSGLSIYGILPALLMGIDVKPLLASAKAMAKNSSFSVKLQHNPAVLLAQVLASYNKKNLFIHLGPSLTSMGVWLSQLIAESLGKDGQGMVPIIIDDEKRSPDISIGLEGESIKANRLSITLSSPSELGGMMFRWQLGVALAGVLLDINPFDQPDVERSKELTKEILAKLRNGEKISEEPDLGGHQFLSEVMPGDYCAILSWLDEDEQSKSELDKLKISLASLFDQAVMLENGPRYLHSTGQLFKGGVDNGHFLLITGFYEKDYLNALGTLSMAEINLSQALGDLQAMKEKGRKIIRIDIKDRSSLSSKKIMGELCK